MEWEALVPVLVGAVAATAGGAVQQWWAAKRSDSEWVRNLRFEACVRVLTNYESFTDSLFWMSNEWDPYVHGPKPDPVPDLGESDSRLQTAVDELQILGPPAVAQAAADLMAAAEDYRGSIAEGGYSHWGRHHKLRHKFLVAAIAATGTQVDVPERFDWQAWHARFKALDSEK